MLQTFSIVVSGKRCSTTGVYYRQKQRKAKSWVLPVMFQNMPDSSVMIIVTEQPLQLNSSTGVVQVLKGAQIEKEVIDEIPFTNGLESFFINR